MPNPEDLSSNQPQFGDISPLDTSQGREQLLEYSGWKPQPAEDISKISTSFRNPPKDDSLGRSYFGEPSGASDPRDLTKSITVNREALSQYPSGSMDKFGLLDVPHTYEHEAHHQEDLVSGNFKNNYIPSDLNEATILADVNSVKQHAAQTGNRELFDQANELLWDYHNDPGHLNHAVSAMHMNQDLPDWYQKKYFNYLKQTPNWQGEQASNTLPRGSSRSIGEDFRQYIDTLPGPNYTGSLSSGPIPPLPNAPPSYEVYSKDNPNALSEEDYNDWVNKVQSGEYQPK